MKLDNGDRAFIKTCLSVILIVVIFGLINKCVRVSDEETREYKIKCMKIMIESGLKDFKQCDGT